jgi:hypothetical protein
MDNMNEPQGTPAGYRSIGLVPGIGTIAFRTLTDYGIRNLLELARLDPYDERFTKLGEGFPRWVLYARNTLADEIIGDVEVTQSEIRVTVQKLYDPDVTLKSIMGRLGVYYIYVEASLYDSQSGYTISITPKPEYAVSVQWNEYRFNASQFVKKGTPKETGRAQVTVQYKLRWRNFKDFEQELFDSLKERKDLRILFNLFFKGMLSPRLNILFVWGESSANRTVVRHMMSKINPYLVHVTMGGNSSERLESSFKKCVSGGVLFIDELEKSEPQERQAILDILSVRRYRTDVGKQTLEIPSGVIINGWARKGARFLDPEILGLVDVPFRVPRSHAPVSWVKFIEQLTEDDGIGLYRLVAELLERKPVLAYRPSESQISFRIPADYSGLGASFLQGVEKLALGISRSKYKDKVEEEDYREAVALMRECVKSLSVKGAEGDPSS